MLTVKQAAEILGVSRSQVTRLIKSGQLVGKQIGQSLELFIEEQDLKDFQERRRKRGRPAKQAK